jgi:hypothetical protein
MKFMIQFIAIALAAFLLELFMPWWCIAIAAAAGGYALKSKVNFLAGLLGIALLWVIKSLDAGCNFCRTPGRARGSNFQS